MKRILFVSSEVYPYIKTGGLADVSGSLPAALQGLGHDVHILMPGYKDIVDQIRASARHRSIRIGASVEIVETEYPGTQITVWLVTHGQYFDRHGNPYMNPEGMPWFDNADRFGFFCRIAVELGMNRLGFKWRPDIIHCNDWQTGLVPALLEEEPLRPATVFTVHNLAYQGLFPPEAFQRLNLPARLWSMHALEFHGQLSFIKGGLVYADRITTVSPRYAQEIQGNEHGCGLNGVLTARAGRLNGILNGIDEHDWDPATDSRIPHHYSADDLSGKALNKQILQQRLNLAEEPGRALLALVGRLVLQKGIDVLINALPELMKLPIQLVVLGSGDKSFGMALEGWSRLNPEQIAVQLDYDEDLSHLIEAGADIFLMPSRFEPCGLNQMYSQHYGTPPIVRNVGGLADTVTDTTPETLCTKQATGFIFEEANANDFLRAVKYAIELYAQPELWLSLQKTGMTRDFSWHNNAVAYLNVYDLALQDHASPLNTSPRLAEFS
ncbi:glycogen synthase GlgA [Candidatus Methylospira mobilis]|uniref:glycogen synthase GlgA n=1 Tax=Candidatus Methylospira mobilis TaxID=1808979 RepID=UPI0028EBC4EA|nr:glycogen synthase GlgA [Candidatus Methylospira mobilis]WNV06660.1 glycogen synthase GlgA [Candidatus Methylospira mobilis]